MPTTQDYVLVGKFKRTHGVRGDIRIQSYTDPFSNILHYPLWYQASPKAELKQLEFEHCKEYGVDILVKIKGIHTPEEAKKFTNMDIYTVREAIPAIEDDEEVYWVDLVGCSVTYAGNAVGQVIEVMETGANEVLVIQYGKKRYMMPYINQAVGKVDIANKTIELLWSPEDML